MIWKKLFTMGLKDLRSSRSQMFFKKGFIKIFANFTGKHQYCSLFLIKLPGPQAPRQAFSCEICEIFKNIFFYRTPPAAASART